MTRAYHRDYRCWCTCVTAFRTKIYNSCTTPPLVSIAFLSADDPLRAYIGSRYLTKYKKTISGRLGMPGLERLVKEATGKRPRPDTAYLFITRGNKATKILIRVAVSTNMLELRDGKVRPVLELCERLGI